MNDPDIKKLYEDEATFLNKFMHPPRGSPPNPATIAVTLSTRALEVYQEILRLNTKAQSNIPFFDIGETFTTITLLNDIFLNYESVSLDESLTIFTQLRISKRYQWARILSLSEEEQIALLNTLVERGFLVFSDNRYSLAQQDRQLPAPIG